MLMEKIFRIMEKKKRKRKLEVMNKLVMLKVH